MADPFGDITRGLNLSDLDELAFEFPGLSIEAFQGAINRPELGIVKNQLFGELSPQQLAELSQSSPGVVPALEREVSQFVQPTSQTTSSAFFPGIGLAGPNIDTSLGPFGQSQFDALARQDAANRQGVNSLLTTSFNPQPGQIPLPIGNTTFPTVSGDLGTVNSVFGGGPIGSVLGGIFGGGGSQSTTQSGGGGGGLGTLGTLALGGLIGGGLGLLFGGDATERSSQQQVRLPPPTAQELELLGINTAFAIDQLRAFRNQLNTQQIQNTFVESLFSNFQREQQAAATAVSPEQRGAIDAQRLQREQSLIPFEDEFGNLLLQDARTGNVVNPQQLALIQGQADLAIESGLSDLGRFRDETLNQIKLNSAARGLRPTDTPIQNQFSDVGIEASRQAEQLIRGVRGQQFQQALEFPLAANDLRLRQVQGGSDILNRRRAFEATLGDQARNQRLQLGQGSSAIGASLATGLNPASALGILSSQRTASPTISQSDRPSTLQTIGQVAQGIGNVIGSGIFR